MAADGRSSAGGDLTRLWLVVAGVVAAIFAGVFLAVVAPDLGSDAPVAPWRSDASLAGSAVGLALVVAGLVSMRRARMLNLSGWPGVWSLGPAQRRRVLRAVRAGAGAGPGDQDAAVVAARALHRQGTGWLLYAGIAANVIAQLLSAQGVWTVVLLTAGAVVLVPAVVAIRRDGRRAQAWLAAHPPPSPAARC